MLSGFGVSAVGYGLALAAHHSVHLALLGIGPLGWGIIGGTSVLFALGSYMFMGNENK